MAEHKEKIRLDKYLWSIRIYKTRSIAAEACEKGRVKLGSDSLKPARTVKVGDTYHAKTEGRNWVVRVTGLIDHRLPFVDAVKYYEDLTPPEELEKKDFMTPSFYTGKRLSKTGRPTKEQRRNRDTFLEDDNETDL